MRIRRRRARATSLVASIAIVVAGLSGTSQPAVSAMTDPRAVAHPVETASADPAASAKRSDVPELSESVPEDAVFLLAKRYGRGDSKRLHFRSRLFTVAFTCEGRGRTERVAVAMGGYTSRKVRCGLPYSLTVNDDQARQWVRVDAPRSVRWVMAVYEGTPVGVS
jgi:hypothetical protein